MTDARAASVFVEAIVQGTSDVRVCGEFVEVATSYQPQPVLTGIFVEVALGNTSMQARGWGVIRT